MRTCNIITDFLVKNDIILERDKEIYLYGLLAIESDMTNILITSILACITGKYLELATIVFVFVLIRKYSGGYHASSSIRCKVVFLILEVCILTAVEGFGSYFMVSIVAFIILSVLGGILVIIFSPCNNQNKTKDKDDYGKFRSRVAIRTIIVLLFANVIYLDDIYQSIAVYMIFTMYGITVLLIVAHLTNGKEGIL